MMWNLRFTLWGVLVAVVAATAFAPGGMADDAHEIRSVLLLESQGLRATVQYPTAVSPLMRRWLTIRFENTTLEPITVENAHYDISRVDYDPDTGARLVSSGLSSGNTYDLFGFAWGEPRKGPHQIILEPGSVHEVTERPSEYSIVLLKIDRGRDVRVDSSFHLRITFGDGSISTPEDGVPFSFVYLAPDDEDIEALRAELLATIADLGKHMTRVPWRFMALLDCPAVIADLGPSVFLDALEQASYAHYTYRNSVVRFLSQKFADHEEVIARFLLWLQSGDLVRMRELYDANMIWDRSFIEPLLAIYENHEPTRTGIDRVRLVLELLHRNRDDWIDDETIQQRLLAVVRPHKKPWLLSPSSPLTSEQASQLEWYYKRLAMTGDPSVIQIVVPTLRDKRKIHSRGGTYGWPPPVLPPLRVCDAALDTILTIRHGHAALGYSQDELAQIRRMRDSQKQEKAFVELRNRMIEELLESLGGE